MHIMSEIDREIPQEEEIIRSVDDYIERYKKEFGEQRWKGFGKEYVVWCLPGYLERLVEFYTAKNVEDERKALWKFFEETRIDPFYAEVANSLLGVASVLSGGAAGNERDKFAEAKAAQKGFHTWFAREQTKLGAKGV